MTKTLLANKFNFVSWCSCSTNKRRVQIWELIFMRSISSVWEDWMQDHYVNELIPSLPGKVWWNLSWSLEWATLDWSHYGVWAPPGPTLTLLMYWGLQQQEQEEGAEVSRRAVHRVSQDLHDGSHKSYTYFWATWYLETPFPQKFTLFQGRGFFWWFVLFWYFWVT